MPNGWVDTTVIAWVRRQSYIWLPNTVGFNLSPDRSVGIRRHLVGEPDVWKWS